MTQPNIVAILRSMAFARVSEPVHVGKCHMAHTVFLAVLRCFFPCCLQMGRRLVYRSEPPVLKRKHRESQEKRDKEEEELQYFFS